MDCNLSLSMEFSRQDYWSELSFPSWDLPDPGIKPGSPAWQVDALPPELPGKPLHWDWSHPQTPTGETLLHWHCLPASARGCPSPAPRTGAAFAISVIFHPDSYHLESVSLWFMSLTLLSLEIGKINTVISKFIAGFHINSPSLCGPLEREVGGGDRDGEYMYIQGWFMSMYDKNHYNIVK